MQPKHARLHAAQAWAVWVFTYLRLLQFFVRFFASDDCVDNIFAFKKLHELGLREPASDPATAAAADCFNGFVDHRIAPEAFVLEKVLVEGGHLVLA